MHRAKICSLKGKLRCRYLAIRHSKALAIRIRRQYIFSFLLKGVSLKFVFKFPAFTRFFTFKEPVSAQVLEVSCSPL